MKLVKDITFHNRVLSDMDRITINSGCHLFSGKLQGYECPANTYIPNEDWRSLSHEEAEMLFSGSNDINTYQQIGVITLPQHLVKGVEDIGIMNVQDIKEGNRLKEKPDVQKLLLDIEDFCKTFQIINEHQIGIGLIYKNAVCLSATYDRYVGSYIGLHLDSWEHDSIINRNFSRNRICFNLGKYDRYITFCNLSLYKMYSMVCLPDTTINPRDLAKLFLQTMPDYPILKIRIRPFEGYIFPTENLIHDGRSSSDSQLDITYTLRSYYTASCHI